MPHIDVNGLQIHYRDTGGDGFPLVLAHGFTGNARNWALTAPAFREQFRIISPDHRGHGLSGRPTDREAYNLDFLADDLFQLLRSIDVKSCYLVGHSMGGMIAQLLTLAHPELVRALVLVDTAAETPKSLRAVERAEDRQRMIRLVDEGGMEVLFELNLKAADERIRQNPAFVATWREQFLMTSPDAYVGCAVGMAKRRPTVDRLHEIKAPTLIIYGEQDEPFVDASRVMHEAIPGSELTMIPNCGHNPQIEKPSEFNELLAGFLSRVHAGAAA